MSLKLQILVWITCAIYSWNRVCKIRAVFFFLSDYLSCPCVLFIPLCPNIQVAQRNKNQITSRTTAGRSSLLCPMWQETKAIPRCNEGTVAAALQLNLCPWYRSKCFEADRWADELVITSGGNRGGLCGSGFMTTNRKCNAALVLLKQVLWYQKFFLILPFCFPPWCTSPSLLPCFQYCKIIILCHFYFLPPLPHK